MSTQYRVAARIHVLVVACALFAAHPVQAQMRAFPPGTFRIDRFPVACGRNITVLNPQLRDAGMNDLQGHIYLNPTVVDGLPTSLKFFIYAHECGHSMVGPNESAADCWAIQAGKEQGWFTAQNFPALIQFFANNPGDWTHAPGPVRLRRMAACFAAAP